MKNLKKIFAILAILSLFTVSCKKEKEHIQDQLDYNLTVKNTSTKDYQLFISVESGHKGYVPHGIIKAGKNTVIKKMAIHVKYFIGTTDIGGNIHDVVSKATVEHGSGSLDYSVDIN